MENMMIKKYLTTPEEILALKDTDTKIYIENNRGYFKYVNDIVCYFEDDYFYFNSEIMFGPCYEKKYILVEEPVKELTEKDRGMLCKFMKSNQKRIGILACFTNTKKPVAVGGEIFDKCCRLTPEEVAEITGYKVEG